jgi:hypothetical protein
MEWGEVAEQAGTRRKLKSFSRAQFYNADGFAPLQTLTIPADPTSNLFYSEFWIQPFIVDDIDFLV